MNPANYFKPGNPYRFEKGNTLSKGRGNPQAVTAVLRRKMRQLEAEWLSEDDDARGMTRHRALLDSIYKKALQNDFGAASYLLDRIVGVPKEVADGMKEFTKVRGVVLDAKQAEQWNKEAEAAQAG